MLLIREREPERNFVFPPKLYKDNRSKSAQMKRYCNGEWFKRFKFISYSKQSDGYMPSKGKKIKTEPFSNWKDAVVDLKSHSTCDYHINSNAKLAAFIQTSTNTASRIDVTLTCDNQAKVNQNKKILASILDCLVFCGRQGIALRNEFAQVTKYLKDILILLQRMQLTHQKHHRTIYSDSFNWEQLGLIVRYCSPEGKPVERFLEFIACSEITGEAICDNIIKSLTEVSFDTQLCRSQTMDGAGNMAGKNGCPARFTRHSPRALYHYCSSHDLNLVLCKSCQVKEVHIMLDTMKQLGIFFKYSPKRSRRFEEAIEEVSTNKIDAEKKIKRKNSSFSTRWVEKHTCLDDFEQMYEALILCLDAIATQERRWDSNTVVEANGVLKKITDSSFIMCFTTVHYYFGYFSGLSKKLQGSSTDIIQAYDLVENVKELVDQARNDESIYDKVFDRATQMGNSANLPSLQPPR
ncbi:LOW QUALITY PROTEIN: P52K-like protein [Mya arenaria]|uniref:P52K-like protein n=1 Tax=Mya arenaria TaxID=6604 RepID=A0ABY7DAQ9_MYAAR|nr:LOW QUALITY PROTEIN: P52K-like protein [Mya arenaria]